jgi:hypothetical protein
MNKGNLFAGSRSAATTSSLRLPRVTTCSALTLSLTPSEMGAVSIRAAEEKDNVMDVTLLFF